jgi:hypothetical protein
VTRKVAEPFGGLVRSATPPGPGTRLVAAGCIVAGGGLKKAEAANLAIPADFIVTGGAGLLSAEAGGADLLTKETGKLAIPADFIVTGGAGLLTEETAKLVKPVGMLARPMTPPGTRLIGAGFIVAGDDLLLYKGTIFSLLTIAGRGASGVSA